MSNERDEIVGIIDSEVDIDWIDGSPEKLADLILAAGYRKPRVITSIEDCIALPDEAVILTKGGIVFRKYVGWFKEGKDGWIRCTFGQNDPLTIESLGYHDYAHFPATVIHEGDSK